MKRKIQKLTLTKETLRSLEETNLPQVVGGTLDNSCVGTCRCTDRTIPCSICCR